MPLIDNDLKSIQEARILLEQMVEVKCTLEGLPESIVDGFIEKMREQLLGCSHEFAKTEFAGNDYANIEDLTHLTQWVLSDLLDEVADQTPVGRIVCARSEQGHPAAEVALPKGVVLSLLPDWLGVPTMLSQLLFAVRAKCPIMFSARARTHEACAIVMRRVHEIARSCHYPEQALGFLDTFDPDGELWLATQDAVRMVVDARECDRLCASGLQGKDVYYASIGNNPVFVEASADIALSADEIIAGKTFCHGLIPGAEQAVVVEKAVADKLISALKERGAYLLDDAAAERLATTLFDASGRPYPELIGKSACDLARRADIAVPDETSVLVVERPYVSEHSVFSKAKYAPVLSLYIEDNWRFACEKCIEIILNSGQGNSLAIFSQDPEVVEQFILKKPVGRILVNVSTGLGSIGCRAALPKTLTIASWDQATTSDLGVCYADFIRYRQIGCAFAREAHELIEASAYRTAAAEPKPSSIQTPNASLRVACEDKQAEANTPNDWFSSLLESIANNG